MTFPNIDDYKRSSLDHIEPIGVFRCPNCSKVEEENEKLREEVKKLKELLDLEKEENTD